MVVDLGLEASREDDMVLEEGRRWDGTEATRRRKLLRRSSLI